MAGSVTFATTVPMRPKRPNGTVVRDKNDDT
jgi:hypothetical protein